MALCSMAEGFRPLPSIYRGVLVRSWHCGPELRVPHPWRCPRARMGPWAARAGKAQLSPISCISPHELLPFRLWSCAPSAAEEQEEEGEEQEKKLEEEEEVEESAG